jgi:hypothetical protein
MIWFLLAIAALLVLWYFGIIEIGFFSMDPKRKD